MHELLRPVQFLQAWLDLRGATRRASVHCVIVRVGGCRFDAETKAWTGLDGALEIVLLHRKLVSTCNFLIDRDGPARMRRTVVPEAIHGSRRT